MLQQKPKTIQIFLPTGDPSGIRIAEQTTSIIRVIEIPRKDLSEFSSMDEAKQVGLYFLLSGENKDEIYIGQSGSVGSRLMQHHKEDKKDWDRALVVISLTHNLTQTHVLYLESVSIERAKLANRYEVINGNSGSRPFTPTPLKADCDEIHEIASLLMATLGYPIFESLVDLNAGISQTIYYCTRSGVNAKGIYTNEGFVVLKGSSAPWSTKRQTEQRYFDNRDSFLVKGIIKKEDDRFVFTQDYLFKTPSGASGFLLLASSNGWLDWKTDDKITLRDSQAI